MSENFEALGRYHSACDKAVQASRRRRRALSDLALAINATNGMESSGHLAFDFDVPTARRLLEEAAEASADMTRWANEANAVAVAAGKPPLRIGEAYRVA